MCVYLKRSVVSDLHYWRMEALPGGCHRTLGPQGGHSQQSVRSAVRLEELGVLLEVTVSLIWGCTGIHPLGSLQLSGETEVEDSVVL